MIEGNTKFAKSIFGYNLPKDTDSDLKDNSQTVAGKKKRDTKVWINVGKRSDCEEYPLSSLVLGIPLDSMEPVAVKGKPALKKHRALQNKLLAQLRRIAETLEPGEERFLKLDVQIRRVEDDEADAAQEELSNHEFDLEYEEDDSLEI